MNNISITISTTDNRTQAFGYNPKFYQDETKRNADIVSDLEKAKELYGDKIAIISFAEWDKNIENSNGLVFTDIDKLIKEFDSKEK